MQKQGEQAGPLLITVSSTSTRSAHLWSLGQGTGDAPAAQVTRRGFMGEALRAAERAAFVLPRAVPMLWGDLDPIQSQTFHAQLIGRKTLDGSIASPPASIDGDSVGLTFLLSMAAGLLGRPVPADCLASAALNAEGQILPVGAIVEKAEAVAELAPSVNRFFVCADQVEEAREAGTRLEIVGLTSASHALREVFGESAFSDRLFAMSRRLSEDEKDQMVEFFFRSALGGRRSFIEWGALVRSADVLKRSAPQLTAVDHWKLQFAANVAARHDGTRTTLAIPDGSTLRAFPEPIRLRVLTHMLQHSADTGSPGLMRLDSLLAEPLGVPLKQGFSEHLALRGARARLLAINGYPDEALRIQQQLADAFVERMEYEAVSFQLSEWYRLTGALRRLPNGFSAVEAEESFKEAERVRGFAVMRAAFDGQASTYVRLARARCRLDLAIANGSSPSERSVADTLDELHHLCTKTPSAPGHVKASACRVGLAAASADDRPRWVSISRELFDRKPVFEALSRLDHALESSDSETAENVLGEVEGLEPGCVKQLIASTPDGTARTLWVARLYPY